MYKKYDNKLKPEDYNNKELLKLELNKIINTDIDNSFMIKDIIENDTYRKDNLDPLYEIINSNYVIKFHDKKNCFNAKNHLLSYFNIESDILNINEFKSSDIEFDKLDKDRQKCIMHDYLSKIYNINYNKYKDMEITKETELTIDNAIQELNQVITLSNFVSKYLNCSFDYKNTNLLDILLNKSYVYKIKENFKLYKEQVDLLSTSNNVELDCLFSGIDYVIKMLKRKILWFEDNNNPYKLNLTSYKPKYKDLLEKAESKYNKLINDEIFIKAYIKNKIDIIKVCNSEILSYLQDKLLYSVNINSLNSINDMIEKYISEFKYLKNNQNFIGKDTLDEYIKDSNIILINIDKRVEILF